MPRARRFAVNGFFAIALKDAADGERLTHFRARRIGAAGGAVGRRRALADEFARHAADDAFADRMGTPEFEARVKDLTMPIEFNLENMNHFIDWTKSTPFEVQRGEGECAV